MVRVRVSLKLEAGWDFFSRRIEWRPRQIVLIHFLECYKNAISSGKKNKQTKKLQEPAWKFIEKHMKIHRTKVPSPATKEDKCCFVVSSWLRSHSPSHSRATTYILLQSAMVCYYKVRQLFYYKVRQVFQSATIITKCDRTVHPCYRYLDHLSHEYLIKYAYFVSMILKIELQM